VATDRDELIVELVADVKKMVAGLEKGQREVQTFTKRAKNSFKSIKNALGPIGGAVAAAFSVNAIKNFITSTIEANDQLGKTAKKLGIGVEAFQEFRFAAERSGVAIRSFDMAIQRFSRAISETSMGFGQAKRAFDAMGISVVDEHGNLKKTEDLLMEVADGLAEITDQSQRVSIAFDLFGMRGVDMVNMLQNGSEAVADLRQELRDLNGVISEEAVQRAEELQDSITDLTKAYQALKAEILYKTSPALARGMDALKLLFKKDIKEIISIISDPIKRIEFLAEVEAIGAMREASKVVQENRERERALERAQTENHLKELDLRAQGDQQYAEEYSFLIEKMGAVEEDAYTESAHEWGRSLNQRYREFQKFRNIVEPAYDQFWMTLANADMTGAERWKALQNAITQAFMRFIGERVKIFLFGELQTRAFSKATTAEIIANNVAQAASFLKTAAATILSAIASAIRWLVATLGPLGIALSAGAAGAIIGLFNRFKGALGFEKGGIIEEGQVGFFEGRGREIIAPERDFRDVFAEYTRELFGLRQAIAIPQLATAGPGPVQVTFNISAVDGESVRRVTRDKIVPELKRLMGRGEKI